MKKIKFYSYGLITLLLIIILYFGLLPLTFYSNSFRYLLLILIALFTLPNVLKYQKIYKNNQRTSYVFLVNKEGLNKVRGIYYLIGLLFILYMILGISTWPIFNSSRYQNLIEVNESVGFAENIEEISQTKVPVVDEDLAYRLGDKKLGEYKGLGSQFTVNDYTMIEMNDELYWVGALEYTGFFKWVNNKDEGVPGYIKIKATDSSDVEFVDYNMKYVPSAYFEQDLMRKIYLSGHFNKLFSHETAFELDEKGHPYYVKTVLNKKFAYTSGTVAVGVVVVDAVNGDVKYYNIDDAPDFIDRIQPSNIIIEQLDYYGKYIHGYFNTLFAKKEVLQVSEGYSYLYNDNEFYLYTGLTSVGADESIVGFTLTNMRTKETTFYHIGGATEFSAQNSAQGAVQDLGYKANWPILVNFENQPTYFMTLKDNEGLIKKYAYVNVKDYSVYGIGDTLISAQSSYRQHLRESSVNPNTGGNTTSTVTSNIIQFEQVNISGTSYYYIVLADNPSKLYIASYNVSFELPLSKIGDTVNMTYYPGNNDHVYTVESFNNLSITIIE